MPWTLATAWACCSCTHHLSRSTLKWRSELLNYAQPASRPGTHASPRRAPCSCYLMSDLAHIKRLLDQPEASTSKESFEPQGSDSSARDAGRKRDSRRHTRGQHTSQTDGISRREASSVEPRLPLHLPLRRWSIPSPQSTASAWHCQVCGVHVTKSKGAGYGEWSVHIDGIRHRRNALSRQLGAEPGSTVVSTFEAEPGENLAYTALFNCYSPGPSQEPSHLRQHRPTAERFSKRGLQDAAGSPIITACRAEQAVCLHSQELPNNGRQASSRCGGMQRKQD